jgi:hypothetical protein
MRKLNEYRRLDVKGLQWAPMQHKWFNNVHIIIKKLKNKSNKFICSIMDTFVHVFLISYCEGVCTYNLV